MYGRMRWFTFAYWMHANLNTYLFYDLDFLIECSCQYDSYKILWNVFVHIWNHWNAMTIKFVCSYDVDINMYILCCSNRICACPSGRSCLQVTPPSGLCFAGVLINFRSGKFQALDMSFFSKGHAGFFREFWHDLC